MRQKNSLLFIRTFLLSIVVASPFLIKQVIFKKEDFSPSENMDNYEEEIKDGDLICTDMIYYSRDLKKNKKR